MAASPSDGSVNPGGAPTRAAAPRKSTRPAGIQNRPLPPLPVDDLLLSTAEILLEDRNVDGGTAMSSPPCVNNNKSGRAPLPSVKFTKMPPAHRPHRPVQSDGRRESGYDNLQKQAHQHVPLNPVYDASTDAPNEGRSIWERLRNHGQRIAIIIIIIIWSVVMVTLMVHVILVHTGSQPSHRDHDHPVTTNRGTGTTDSTAHAWQSSAVLRTVTSADVIVDPARRRGPPDSVPAGVETSGPTQISRALPVDTKEVSGGGSSISFDLESGDGKLKSAKGVAVSADNKIWVADRSKACLQVYSMAGTYLSQFPKGAPGIGYPLNKTPVDVSIDRDGHLWVLMNGYPKSPDTVAQFTRECHLKAKFDLPDTVPRGANRGMTVGLRNNHVFVTWSDGYNGGVQAFQPDGKLLWDGQRRMKMPMYVAVNEEGNVFVSDYNTHYIYMYDAAGQYVLRFGGPGLSGSGLNYPRGICVDKSGHIVVADSDNQRVVVYKRRGDYVRHVAIRALHLRDVAVGPGGQLVVLNYNTITVLPFY